MLHQSKNGSSAGFRAGECVSLSGYVEKFEVSFGALKISQKTNKNMHETHIYSYFVLDCFT